MKTINLIDLRSNDEIMHAFDDLQPGDVLKCVYVRATEPPLTGYATVLDIEDGITIARWTKNWHPSVLGKQSGSPFRWDDRSKAIVDANGIVAPWFSKGELTIEKERNPDGAEKYRRISELEGATVSKDAEALACETREHAEGINIALEIAADETLTLEERMGIIMPYIGIRVSAERLAVLSAIIKGAISMKVPLN